MVYLQRWKAAVAVACCCLICRRIVAAEGSTRILRNPISSKGESNLSQFTPAMSIRGGANAPEPSGYYASTPLETQNAAKDPAKVVSNANTTLPKFTLFQNIVSLFTSTESFFARMIAPFASDPDITAIIGRICSYAFWTYMTMCLLGTLGIDTKPFLTFLNVALITFGFAAKDLITNSFAGIFILFTRPFSRGAIIRINGFRGQVVSVDVRYVKLVDLKDGSEIMIPLSMVYGSPIVIEAYAQSNGGIPSSDL